MKTLLCIVAFTLIHTVTVYAQTTNYQVYSLFVVNIAKYSSWPAINGELQMVVFGKSKIYEELAKQNGKNLNGHNVKVSVVENINEIGQPHILFLPDGKSNVLDEIVKHLEGKSTMIITEREGLFKKGACFSFVVMENNTLRYDVNVTALEKRQIKVSKSLTAAAHSMR